MVEQKILLSECLCWAPFTVSSKQYLSVLSNFLCLPALYNWAQVAEPKPKRDDFTCIRGGRGREGKLQRQLRDNKYSQISEPYLTTKCFSWTEFAVESRLVTRQCATMATDNSYAISSSICGTLENQESIPWDLEDSYKWDWQVGWILVYSLGSRKYQQI